MRPAKIFSIFLAFIAIGFLVIPSTITLFAGQHYWYPLNDTGNDVPCEKCHADIADEMSQIHGPHTDETGYGRFECEYCHRTFPINDQNSTFTNYTYASGDNGFKAGGEAHAASTVACMYCHSGGSKGAYGDYRGYDAINVSAHTGVTKNCIGCHNPTTLKTTTHDNPSTFSNSDCWKCHLSKGSNEIYYVPPAGGFGLTAYPYENGSISAHKSFVMGSIDNDLLQGANEACIACHTAIPVKINFSHKRSIEFDIGFAEDYTDAENLTTESGMHNWTITNWAANGTAYATVWGNTTGNASTTYNASVWPGKNPDGYSGGGYS